MTLTGYLLTAHYRIGQVNDTTADIRPAWQFLHHGTFRLDHAADLARNDWVQVIHGHLVSNRMAGAILAGVPVTALLSWTHLSPAMVNTVNAAVLTALTITVLGAVFRRIAPARTAMAGALVIGFGTPLWTVAASETWPQTNDALWLAIACLAISQQRLYWAALALVPALMTRPHLACVALVLGLGLGIRARSLRPVLAFGMSGVVAGVLLLFWNHWYLGQWNLLGAYQAHATTLTNKQIGGVPYWRGVLATFFSPSLGLLVFTPVAGLATVWMVRARRHMPAWSALALTGGFAYEALQLKLDVFTGGSGFFGGRLTIELIVLASPAAVACYVPWSHGHPRRRLITTALCAASIATYATGARLTWWLTPVSLDHTWVSYYPYQVIRAAGATGYAAAAMTLCAALGFTIVSAIKIRDSRPVEIVAPRDAIDDTIGKLARQQV